MAITPIQFSGPTLPAAPSPPAKPSIAGAPPVSFSSTLSSLSRAAAPTSTAPTTTAPPTAAPATATPTPTDLAGGTRVLDGVGGAASVAGASGAQAKPGSYPHLKGDLDGSPELLARLEALAARRGETFNITSGHRSVEEQQRLWDNRHNNPYPVARPGTSRHHSGTAADVTIGGRAIQDVIPAAELRAAGLAPLAGDAVHVELP